MASPDFSMGTAATGQGSGVAQASADAGNVGSMVNMIAVKEEEVTRLRELSQREMEHELTTTKQQLAAANQKISTLKEDFQYNLGLLEDRDTELDKFESLLHTMTLQAEQKDALLAKMRSEAAEMESELQIQWERAEEAHGSMAAMKMDATQLVEGSRLGAEEALLRQREEWEAERRRLQRLLAEAEEEVERQRRGMSQGFAENTRALESGYRQRVEDAETRAEIAEELAAKRVNELNLCLQKGEALEDRLEEREVELRSVQMNAANEQRLRNNHIAELEDRVSRLTSQAVRVAKIHEAQLAGLMRRAETAEVAREEAARSSSSLRSAAAMEALQWEQHLEDAQARVKAKQDELESCEDQLSSARRKLERQEALHKSELEALRSELQKNGGTIEDHIRELQAQVSSKDAELASLNGALEPLKSTLQICTSELERLKRVAADAELEAAEAKRQLVQAQEQGEARSTEAEAKTRDLTQQRDEAQAALKSAQEEAQALREQQQQQGPYPMFKRNRPEPLKVSGGPTDPSAAAMDKSRPDTGSELPSPSTIASPPASPDYALPPPEPTGTSASLGAAAARAAARTPQSAGRYDNMRSSLEKLIHGQGQGPVDDSAEVRSSLDSQNAEAESIEMENHRLRMAVLELEAQQERLKATIAMMRSEMEQQMQQTKMQAVLEQQAAALKLQVEALIRDKAELMQQVRAATQERDRAAQLLQQQQQRRQQSSEGEGEGTYMVSCAAEGPLEGSASGAWRSPVEAQGHSAKLKQEPVDAGPEASGLLEELQRAKLEVQRLEQDNERLMEVGNELRAERNMMASMGAPCFQPFPGVVPPQAGAPRPTAVIYALPPPVTPEGAGSPQESQPAATTARGKEKKRNGRRSPGPESSSDSRLKLASASLRRRAKSVSPERRPASALGGAMRSPLKRSKVSKQTPKRSASPPLPSLGSLNDSELDGWAADTTSRPLPCAWGPEQQKQEEAGSSSARARSPEASTQTLPSMVSGRASARELPSQRQRLAMLKRRNEDAARPRVRNYNLKEDNVR